MKHKIILSVLCAWCLVCSCNKELNVYPTTSEVDGNVIVDTKSASTVLNGVYYRFANAGVDNNSVPTILWLKVNEIFPSELANTLNSSGYPDGVDDLELVSAAPAAAYIWNYGYDLVNAANGFIKNATPVAKIFLRAFGDAELLLYYGQYDNPASKYGIILRNEFVTSTTIDLPRTGVAAAYSSILADLDTAIADLPALNTQICFANASAAKLLKARVLINRGSAGDYAEVISLTNDVITNGPFTLEDSTKDIFQSKGFSSNEVILGVQPYPTEIYKFQQYNYYGYYQVSDTLVNYFQNDPGSQWVYKNDDRGTIYGRAFGALNELTKYYTGPVVNPVQTALTENAYAFRLTEAYLLEAEAITLSNGDLATAKALLETVEKHSGITDFTAVNNASTASALQLLIVKEEMKNFVGENGADWLALRRLPFATIQTIQPFLKTASQLILPIPYSEMLSNNQVIQNPGY
jgi:hypothetical protein